MGYVIRNVLLNTTPQSLENVRHVLVIVIVVKIVHHVMTVLNHLDWYKPVINVNQHVLVTSIINRTLIYVWTINAITRDVMTV